MSYLVEYRIRIRNRADNADLLIVTSVAGDTAPNYPYLKEPPSGDGASFNPLTNESICASYTGLIVDGITSGTSRVVTAQLEDGNSRQQLGYLKAYVESRSNGGAYGTLCAGYLTLLRLVDAVTWEFTIQDATRVQGGVELFNALSTQTVASFLAAWPNRGVVFGGPVIGSFMTMPDYGGWTMRVHRLTPGGAHLRYWLEPFRVYGPGHWNPAVSTGNTSFDPITSSIADSINEVARSLPIGNFEFQNVALSTINDVMNPKTMHWPGLIFLINGAVFRPISPSMAATTDFNTFWELISTTGGNKGAFAYDDGQNLSDGAIVQVRCLTVLPTDVSPVLIDRHPVDLLTDVWTIAGLAWNAAAATTLKNLMGTGLRHAIQITGSKQMGQFLKEAVFDLGIGVRVNSAGEMVPFATNIFSNVPPTKTITDALVVDGATRLPFELDVTQGLQRVTFKQKTLAPLIGRKVTGIIEGDNELTLLNGSASAFLAGTVEISIPGMLRPDPAVLTPVDLRWLASIAQPLFDRFGGSAQALETEFIRGDGTTDADTANLGDEILVNIKQLPNHNKRLGDDGTVGARAMQIVRITELPDRRTVRLLDSGPNAQPLATKPTHTIAASSDLPRTVAEVTITNAAALNALGYAVRIQIAVTTGSTPATTDYVDWHTTDAAAIPTTAIRLPAVLAGRKVYVRAASRLQGSRDSDWSTGVSVTLTAINDPTSVAAATVSGDGSLEDLSWAIGANATDCVTDIWVRAFGAAFSTAVRQDTLPVGSTRYELTGLTPNTHYTASVQHRDLGTGDTSNAVDVSFTTDSTSFALVAPINPNPVSYARRPLYGIVVVAEDFTADVEVAEAVETAIGAGTYGAFATVGRVASVQGDWTLWVNIAPNDKLRRQLKARHVKDGASPSSYAAIVVATPWSVPPQVAPTYPVGAPSCQITKIAAGTNRQQEVIQFDGALGANDAGPLQWRYKVGTAAFGGYVSTALPSQVTIARAPAYDTPIVLQVLQHDGQTQSASYNVPARFDDTGSGVREDRTRSGLGGVPTGRTGVIDTRDDYNDAGDTPLVDRATKRVFAALLGPTGAHGMDVIERGAGKADPAFQDETGLMATIAKDSRPALLNNHFRRGTDLASDVVESTGRWFINDTYVDASRRPTTLRDTKLANDLTGNGIRLERGRYGAVTVGTRREDFIRGGSGGVDTPAGRINAESIFLSDGTAAVIDAVLRRLNGHVYATDGSTQLIDAANKKTTTSLAVDYASLDPSGTGAGAPTLSIGSCQATPAGGPYTGLDVTISYTHMPSDVTFDVSYNNSGSNIDSKLNQTVSNGGTVSFGTVTFNGSPGRGIVTVVAKKNNGIQISSSIKTANYLT